MPPLVEILEARQLLSAGPKQLVVHAAESIQDAVNAAAPGATIVIDQGVYAQSVHITKPGLHLVGKGNGVVLVNPGGEDNGIVATDAADGLRLDNLTVRKFDENGVLLVRVDDFQLTRVNTQDNGAYGLFPVLSSNGVIDHCTASEHADTGIYVGQSQNIQVSHCTAFANVEGISLENSVGVQANHNEAYDNVVGIAAFRLPGLAFAGGSDILIDHNSVHDNNHVNFGEPGEPESALPSGIGILVAGVERTTVEHNQVSGNHLAGIGVVSSALIAVISGLPPGPFLGLVPKQVVVRHNQLHGNTGSSLPPLLSSGVDLFYDGSGSGNVFEKNQADTAQPVSLLG